MVTNTKSTPKSCSCGMCRRGKGTKTGKFYMRADERAFRRLAKVQLLRYGEDDDTPLAAPRGGYYD